MRLSGLRDDRGSVVVLMMLAVPLLVAMLAILVDFGRITVARARLEAASDRAAYAGAAALAHALNMIAAANWKIDKAWRILSHDLGADSQQGREAALQRIARYEAERNAAFDEIGAVRAQMNDHARGIAMNLLSENAPHAAGEAIIRGEISLSDEADYEAQHEWLTYGSVMGGNFIDPNNVEEGGYEALKYLIKQPGPDSGLGVFARQTVKPMLLGRIMGDVEIGAASASQAFGGSIEGFARKETETVGEAEAQVMDEGSDGLYRAALVPMWTLGDAGAGMFH